MDPHQKIHKPVSTLAIIPKSGSITKLGRQAYAVMLMAAHEQVLEDPKTGMFSAPLHQIIQGFEGSKESMSFLKGSLRSLVSTVVEWQSPTDGESSEWGVCGMLAEVKISMIRGESHITWAYAPSIRDQMLNPDRYAQLQRSTIARAKSHAGLALYENCVRYKDVPKGLTSEHPWEWWVPVLRGKPVKAGTTLEYGIFKRDTLSKAIEEVNEVSEITVTLHEKKSGRSVNTIQFEVRKKTKAIGSEAESGPVRASSLVKAEKMGIPLKIADDHFGTYGNEAFLKALNKLSTRLTQTAAPIGNKMAYLKTMLENGLAEDAVEVQAETEQAAPKVAEDTPVANVAEVKKTQMEEQFASQLDAVKAEIAALGDQARAALVSELKQYASEQKWPARMILRIENGDWDFPMIQGTLCRIWWKKTRGTDWSAAA